MGLFYHPLNGTKTIYSLGVDRAWHSRQLSEITGSWVFIDGYLLDIAMLRARAEFAKKRNANIVNLDYLLKNVEGGLQ